MDSPPEDPGGGQLSNESSQNSALPATSDWAGGRVGASDAPMRLRSYEEIIADAKEFDDAVYEEGL